MVGQQRLRARVWREEQQREQQAGGDPAPLPYAPILNPLALAQAGAVVAIALRNRGKVHSETLGVGKVIGFDWFWEEESSSEVPLFSSIALLFCLDNIRMVALSCGNNW